MPLMTLHVRGSQRQAIAAAVKRKVSFVPQEQTYEGVQGFCPLGDADKVLAWYAESGHARLIGFDYRHGTLISYKWPEEN